MPQLLVLNHVTLDGVMQSPALPDEDTRDGFPYGGWAGAGIDDVVIAKLAEGMARPGSGALLLGRRTYENFYAYWPHQTNNPYTDALNNATKYVASRTLQEPLPWVNSILLQGDAARAVARLKQQHDHMLIMGSGELIRSLMAAHLIDEYLFMIHPLVLGTGRRLFSDGVHASLRLTESIPTPSGVVMATYRTLRD